MIWNSLKWNKINDEEFFKGELLEHVASIVSKNRLSWVSWAVLKPVISVYN